MTLDYLPDTEDSNWPRSQSADHATADGPVPLPITNLSAPESGPERPGSQPRPPAGLLRYFAFLRLLPWPMFWALTDQAIVSVARVATAVMIGRYGSQEELGFYSLGFTILTLVISFQEAMVTTPYTIFVSRYPASEQPTFAANLFLISKLLTGISLVFLAVAIGTLYLVQADHELLPVLIALFLILPLTLVKEFSRRWQIAHLRFIDATIIDSINTFLLLGGLGVLYYYQNLNAFNAFMMVGMSALIASIVWGWWNRRDFHFDQSQFKHALRSCVHFGKWVAGENFLSVFQYYFANWFLFYARDTKEVGAYAACATIVMLSNPFLLGVTGLLSTRSSQEFSRAGEAAVRQIVTKFQWFIAAVMVAFCLAVALCGDWLLTVVFKGEIVDQQATLLLLCAAMIGLGLSYITSCGLRAINQPQDNFYASMIGLAVTATMSLLWVGQASAFTSAGAFLAGTSAMAVYRIWRFLPNKSAAKT